MINSIPSFKRRLRSELEERYQEWINLGNKPTQCKPGESAEPNMLRRKGLTTASTGTTKI